MKDGVCELNITGVHSSAANAFGAAVEELAAAALQEAGLLSSAASINGVEAAALLASLGRKRQGYEEATRLGSLLIRRGLLREDELERALELHRTGESLRLGDALLKLQMCSEDEIRRTVEAQGLIRESLSDLEEFRRKIDSIKERLRLHL